MRGKKLFISREIPPWPAKEDGLSARRFKRQGRERKASSPAAPLGACPGEETWLPARPGAPRKGLRVKPAARPVMGGGQGEGREGGTGARCLQGRPSEVPCHRRAVGSRPPEGRVASRGSRSGAGHRPPGASRPAAAPLSAAFFHSPSKVWGLLPHSPPS